MSLTLPSPSPDAEHPARAPERRRDLQLTANVLRSLFLIAVVLAAGLVLGAGMYGLSHSNRIYEGITLAGTEVGGMTRSEARAAIREDLIAFNAHPLVFISGDQEFSLDPEAAGVFLDVDRTVDTAFAYGRQGSFFERSGRWFNAIISGRESPIQVSYNQENLDATLMTIAPSITRPVINAEVRFNEEGSPVIAPELPGRGFDLVATRQAMIDNMSSLSRDPIEIVSPIMPASVVVGDLESGLAQTESAVSAPLMINGVDTNWGISPADIRKIVTVGGDTQRLIVDREAVQAFVESIATASDREARDAEIEVNDQGVLAAIPGQEGVRVRVSETANLVIGALESGSNQVDLQYESQSPRISDEQAVGAAADGEEMLTRGVTVTWDDGSDELSRAQLLAALTVFVNPEEPEPFTFGFDNNVLSEALSATFSSVEVPVAEPLLRYVDGEVTLVEEGQAGEAVNAQQSIDGVVNALLSGEPESALVIETQEPELSQPAIDRIVVTDVLAESSTYYGDSSDARRHNVEVAAELETGWLVAPGEQFSFAEFIGLVDEENGFVTGFGIVDDSSGTGVTTAPVIGGGICQVSTTIFQAAFWSGLQIDERYSHPYWIQAYGEPPRGMQGLDAMVNIEESGSLDLQFTNTTGDWIAVEVTADGTTVAVRVLGNDPGWDIEVSQPEIYNEIEPATITRYTESPELPEGDQLQVEFAQQGFSSEVTRVITGEDGETIDTYSLISSYAPSQNTILRGTAAPQATPVP